MTLLPMPSSLFEIRLTMPRVGLTTHRRADQRFLLQDVNSFSETARWLGHSDSRLRAEVTRLHHELDASHSGLARSLAENRSIHEQLDRILEGLPGSAASAGWYSRCAAAVC
jgi:hypothetical protein